MNKIIGLLGVCLVYKYVFRFKIDNYGKWFNIYIIDFISFFD